MVRSLEFVAYGRPAPQGSKHRGASGQMREASRFLPAWRREIVLAAQRARIEAGWETATVPCVLAALFVVERPAEPVAHAARYPAVKPDLDKLARALADALKDAGVWADDSLWVATSSLWKLYVGMKLEDSVPVLDRPGVHCRVTTLEDIDVSRDGGEARGNRGRVGRRADRPGARRDGAGGDGAGAGHGPEAERVTLGDGTQPPGTGPLPDVSVDRGRAQAAWPAAGLGT